MNYYDQKERKKDKTKGKKIYCLIFSLIEFN